MTDLDVAEEVHRMVEVDRNGLEVLDRSTCLRLLDGAHLGRLGLSYGALPTILPINFRLVDEWIVFRTGVGTKLDAATSNSIVAFEVDDLDPLAHTGWSVVVTGLAHEITDSQERDRLDGGLLPYWAPAAGDRIIAISTQMISGRRILRSVRPVSP